MLAWGWSKKGPKHVAILGCWRLYMLLCSDGITHLILFCVSITVSAQTQPNTSHTNKTLAGSIWQDLLRTTRNDQVPLCLQQGGNAALRGTEPRAAVIGSPRGTQYRYLRFAHRQGEVRGRRSNDPYIFNFITRRTWEINLITTSGVPRIFWPLFKVYRWGLSPLP